MTQGIPSPTTVHAALIDVVSEAVEDFARWFDEVYAKQILNAGGWQQVRRYVCTDEPHLFLSLCDTTNESPPAVPAAFRSQLGRRHIRTYAADTFRQTSSQGHTTPAPQYLNAIVTHTTAAGADAFEDWYRTVHIPEIVTCPGWLGARRYRSVTTPTQFLTMYDLVDVVTPFATAEYENAVGWDEHEDVLLGYHGFRTYELAALIGRDHD